MIHLELAPVLVLTELLLGDFILLFKEKKKSHFFIRTIISLVSMFIFLNFFPFNSTKYIEMIFYFILFILSLFFVYSSYELNIWEAIYWSLASLIIQHAGYSICSILWLISRPEYSFVILIIIYIILYVFSFFISKKQTGENHTKDNQKILILISLLIIGTTVFLNSFRENFLNDTESSIKIIASIYSLICCILSLALLFGFFEQTRLQNELKIIHYLLHKDKRQYELSKKNFELLNMYYHDLKLIKKNIENKDYFAAYKKENSELLSLLDTSFATQNHALDVILTEKNILCKNNGIVLTCLAEGPELNFLNTTDIYSLFNNLLDNAFEAVKKIEIPEKRLISLKINRKNNFTCIILENYYVPPLIFENGLPKTQKKALTYHGYGLKSVKMLVGKYAGNLSIQTEEDIFYVRILFPRDVKSTPPASQVST